MAVIKVGVVCMGVHESSYLKEELAWDTDKRLRVISIIMSFKTVSYTTKKLKNKIFLSFNNIVYVAMWSLVTYSNCLVIYYRLMLHDYTIKVFLSLVLFNTVLLHHK